MATEELGQAALAQALGALGRGVAREEGQGDRGIHVGEDGRGAGPEALEEGAQLVGEGDALGDEVIAAADESAEGPGLIGEGLQGAEAVAIGAEQVGEQEGVAGVALAASGRVAGAAGLHDIGVDRDDREAGIQKGIDDEARGAFEGDGHGGGGPKRAQPLDQLGQARGGVGHRSRASGPCRSGRAHRPHAWWRPSRSRRRSHCVPPWDLRDTAAVRGPAGRSLIGALGLQMPVALHPVAGWDLSWCESGERVSSGRRAASSLGLSPTPGTVTASHHPPSAASGTKKARSPGAPRMRRSRADPYLRYPPSSLSVSLLRGEGRPVSAVLRLERLTKRYGPVVAVDGVDAEIREGELVSFVGPSGCGKTTLLRMAGGFVRPDAGRIWLDGRDVTRDPPNRRATAMVFQSYALFPHLTVGRQRGVRAPRRGARARRDRRARGGLLARRAAGRARGDRRPVSCPAASSSASRWPARSSCGPACCSSTSRCRTLDANLRRCSCETRSAAPARAPPHRRLRHPRPGGGDVDLRPHRRHDEQVGSSRWGRPTEIYERPATEFVARFVGTANFLDGEVAETSATGGDRPHGARGSSSVHVAGPQLGPGARRSGWSSGRRRCGYRATEPLDGTPAVAGKIVGVSYTGAIARYLVDAGESGSPSTSTTRATVRATRTATAWPSSCRATCRSCPPAPEDR